VVATPRRESPSWFLTTIFKDGQQGAFIRSVVLGHETENVGGGAVFVCRRQRGGFRLDGAELDDGFNLRLQHHGRGGSRFHVVCFKPGRGPRVVRVEVLIRRDFRGGLLFQNEEGRFAWRDSGRSGGVVMPSSTRASRALKA
jgi:hypothetical protein